MREICLNVFTGRVNLFASILALFFGLLSCGFILVDPESLDSTLFMLRHHFAE
jgi:hypothetical protein